MQISEEVASHLKEAGVEVKGYEDVAEAVKAVAMSGTKLWMDPTKVPPPPATPPHPPSCVINFPQLCSLAQIFASPVCSA